MSLADHPTVRAYNKGKGNQPHSPAILDSTELKNIALTAGADDAGIIDPDIDASNGVIHGIDKVLIPGEPF